MVTQAERRAATISALHAAARTAFAEHGFDGVSVDDIAAAAGVTRGAFYHHFASKEALFEAVLEEVQIALVHAVRVAAAPHTDPFEQIARGIDAFIEHAAQPQHSRIALIDAPAVLGPGRYREFEQRHFLDLMQGSVQRLVPQSSARAIELTTRALLAAVCALALCVAERHADLPAARDAARSLIPVPGPPGSGPAGPRWTDQRVSRASGSSGPAPRR